MSIEAMKQALEALESFREISEFTPAQAVHAIAALRTAIAEAEKPAMRPATRDEKIVNPGVYEVPAAIADAEKQEPVAWKYVGAMPSEQEEMKEAAYNLAPWLSAALDDPKVCQEYKDAINGWFDTAMPVPPAAQSQPLTDEQIDQMANSILTDDPVRWWRQLARAIEAAHGIKEQA